MLFKQALSTVVLLSLFAVVACKKDKENSYTFKEVNANYFDSANIMVTFRVADAITNNPPSDMNIFDSLKPIKVYEDGEELSPYEGGRAQVSTPVSFAIDLIVLVDVSGSVSSKIDSVRSSIESFVNTLRNNSANRDIKISIRTFDGSAKTKMVSDFNSPAETLKAIKNIKPGEDESTNLHGAMVETAEILVDHEVEGANYGLKKKGFIIFTDGKDQAARNTLEEASTALSEIKKNAEFVYAVAVKGENYGKNFLANFGTENKDYFFVDKSFKDMAEKFTSIVNNLNALANSYRTVKICSPKRNGIHYVNLEISGSPYPSKFIEFNANGFESGCNVANDKQWKEPKTSKVLYTSAYLTKAEMEISKVLFGKVKNNTSNVFFKESVESPSVNGGWVLNFSEYSGANSVACHILFGNGSSDTLPYMDYTIVDYASYNGTFDTNTAFVGANFVIQSENDELYLIQCRETKDLVNKTELEAISFNF